MDGNDAKALKSLILWLQENRVEKHFSEEKSWVTDNAFITSFNKNILVLKYLEKLLIFLNLRQYSNSTAQPVISGKTIYPILIPLPPLAEQKRIVEKIEALLARLDCISAQIE